jgi:isopentenyl-diphosphate delta-isomerase
VTAVIPAWLNGLLAPVEKLAVHRMGLRHKAVSVFVTRGHRVLIQRRSLDKYHTPGLWANTCCTHPHWGESAGACARRRLREELGITGLDLHWRDRLEYRAAVGDGMTEHEVVDIFAADAPADLDVAPDPGQVMETAWIDLADLAAEVAAKPEMFTPWLRIYLERSRDRLFGAAAA